MAPGLEGRDPVAGGKDRDPLAQQEGHALAAVAELEVARDVESLALEQRPGLVALRLGAQHLRRALKGEPAIDSERVVGEGHARLPVGGDGARRAGLDTDGLAADVDDAIVVPVGGGDTVLGG